MESNGPRMAGVITKKKYGYPNKCDHGDAVTLFELFCAVIPKFSSAANQQTKIHQGNEELRIPYVIFEAELMFLNFQQSGLARLISMDSSIDVRNDCMKQLTSILGMLENMIPQGFLPQATILVRDLVPIKMFLQD
jgi:hypothetical protein